MSKTEAMWEMYKNGSSLKTVGEAFGIGKDAVRYQIIKAGHKTRTFKEASAVVLKPYRSQIKKDIETMSKEEVVKKYGWSATSVSKYYPKPKRKYNLPLLINLYDAGASSSQIAKMYNTKGFYLGNLGDHIERRTLGGNNRRCRKYKRCEKCGKEMERYSPLCKLCYMKLYRKARNKRKRCENYEWSEVLS